MTHASEAPIGISLVGIPQYAQDVSNHFQRNHKKTLEFKDVQFALNISYGQTETALRWLTTQSFITKIGKYKWRWANPAEMLISAAFGELGSDAVAAVFYREDDVRDGAETHTHGRTGAAQRVHRVGWTPPPPEGQSTIQPDSETIVLGEPATLRAAIEPVTYAEQVADVMIDAAETLGIKTYRRSTGAEVLARFREYGDPITPDELAVLYDMNPSTVSARLSGEVHRVGTALRRRSIKTATGSRFQYYFDPEAIEVQPAPPKVKRPRRQPTQQSAESIAAYWNAALYARIIKKEDLNEHDLAYLRGVLGVRHG